MDAQPDGIDSTSAYCVHPTQSWAAGVWHTSDWVTLPAGCVSVRGTVSPPQEVRESPLLAGEVRLAFRDSNGRRVQGCGTGIVARPAFAADETVPVTGHEVGQQPGGFPAQVNNFAFVCNDSLGAQQQPPYGISARIEFKISHREEIYIQAAATLEAFDSAGNSLRIA